MIAKLWTVLCNLVQESDEISGFWTVPVSEAIMSSPWHLNGSPCFPSKCVVLAIHFKITGYTLKRESLVWSVCTGTVFSGASKRWVNLIPCSIAFWWYGFVRWWFSFSIMLCHCEYPLSLNELLSFPWMSGNNVQYSQNRVFWWTVNEFKR